MIENKPDFTEEQWEVIIRSVAEMGGKFTEEECLKLGAWIKRAVSEAEIANMILDGDIYAKFIDGKLTCRKAG